MTRTGWNLGAVALLGGLLMTPLASGADIKAEDIAGKMGSVVDNLGRNQTGEPVQAEQKEIISDLDALIASFERESQGLRNGIKKKGPGMQDSMMSRGPGGSGPLSAAEDGGKDWGKLSDRERDRILQSMSEGFPPEYRTVLERYYRRLAEEKSAKTGSDATKAKAAAAATKP